MEEKHRKTDRTIDGKDKRKEKRGRKKNVKTNGVINKKNASMKQGKIS